MVDVNMTLISEIFTAIGNNPFEFIFLGGMILFIWKFFFSRDQLARDLGREIKYWIKDIPSNIYYAFFENHKSYCGLRTDKIGDTLHLIKICKHSRTHTIDEFVKAKLEINQLDYNRIIHALRNLKLIKRVSNKDGEFWRLVK